ncbi:RICIN domain-containing protein [Pseudomonas gingeri]|uniref:RICIN domain-containing protein n=1 Tax=Pseudomonas TaxID=286 RepID=UPI0015A01B01|nr:MULTISPECIES: RICIN domain-containing protein [Pseudomonas]NVZ65629.1 RICIN domain-containing protein [Pseudomonas gingeri]NVZ75665.1 RICIN domain-containing protein [Pseudomonas gingeri]
MKKSTPSPDFAAPNKANDSGSAQQAKIPDLPCKIVSSADSRSYLYFISLNNRDIRITRAENLPAYSQWRFHSLDRGTYNIRSHPDSDLYFTWTNNNTVFVRSSTGGDDQRWEVVDDGSGLVYIRRVLATGGGGYLCVDNNLTEGSAVELRYFENIKWQKFMPIL